MRKNFLYPILGVALLLAACQETVPIAEPENTVPEKEVSYVIPQEEAVATLMDFMRETKSRADEEELWVDTVYSVVYPQSRAFNDPLVADTILYIANFRNNLGHSRGYAIIAADSRIPEEILAVVEEGELTAERFNRSVGYTRSTSSLAISPFPTEGPGIFTSEDYPGEFFINPNTMSWYDETLDDYFIGNIILGDGLDGVNGYNSRSYTNPLAGVIPPEAYVFDTMLGYALDGIRTHHEHINDNLVFDPVAGGLGFLLSGDIPNGPTLGPHLDPLLADFKYWHQFSPFNDFYPYRTKYESENETRRAPAGSMPLSISKVMAYYNKPTTVVYQGTTVDWTSLHSSLDTDNYQFPTSTGNESAAALLRTISDACDCEYFYEGTFAYPCLAVLYLESEGFHRVRKTPYSFNDVKMMLDNRIPVVVYTIPEDNFLKDHCWNIDGYRISYRTIDGHVDTSVHMNMVHCDFGWKGVSNGWYISKAFEINLYNGELDEGSESGGDLDLHHGLQILTFDRPIE